MANWKKIALLAVAVPALLVFSNVYATVAAHVFRDLVANVAKAMF